MQALSHAPHQRRILPGPYPRQEASTESGEASSSRCHQQPDKAWQYLLFAAEPYKIIAFKIPSREADKSEDKFWSFWNKETKQYFMQFSFKSEHAYGGISVPPSLPPPPPAMFFNQ